MRNPAKWGLPPPQKGETADAWIIIALGIMLVVALLISDPCDERDERNQPQSNLDTKLCQ